MTKGSRVDLRYVVGLMYIAEGKEEKKICGKIMERRTETIDMRVTALPT